MAKTHQVRAAGALALALLGSGCFKSYVAVSFRPAGVVDGPAEVHRPAATPGAAAPIEAVAIRAPASCLAEASALTEGPGIAARSRTILDSRCDVVLGELERALSDRFRVVSWRELAEAERSAGGIPHVAARNAAADAVLVVMDLAATPLFVSDLRGTGVVLSDANPDGASRGKAELSKDAEEVIRDLVERHFADGGLAGVTVQLELALQAAASGEPLWTYLRRVSADLDGARDMRLLVRGRGRTWRPVDPRGHVVAPPPVGADDPIRARMRELASRLAQDVAQRLSGAGRVSLAP